jgi:hypothetical protein
MANTGRPTKRKELWIAKDPFLKMLQDACHLGASSKGLTAAEQGRQLEDSFFRVAVALETFLGDWFARCMHFDTSRVAARAREEVDRHLKQQVAGGWEPEQKILGRTIAHYLPQLTVSVELPKAVSVTMARRLFGTETSTRSWKSAADLKEQVGRYLAHEQARSAVAKLDAADDALLDATIAIRNVLAHRSPHSEQQLKLALSSDELNIHLRVMTITAAGLGRYLRTERGGQPRYRGYYEGLSGIANTLAPFVGKPRKICPDG